MPLITIGINYRNTPIEIREQFQIDDSIEQIISQKWNIKEFVILATCHRTEIYIRSTNFEQEPFTKWLSTYFEIPFEYFYCLSGEEALLHLFRLSCGLDSMMVGETQILGQIKRAFLQAQKLGKTGAVFNRLFKHVIMFGKKAHTCTLKHSVGHAAVIFGERLLSTYQNKKIMILGTGEVGTEISFLLKNKSLKELVITPRKELSTIYTQLNHFDLVFGALKTSEPLPIKEISGFVIDLGMPRNFNISHAYHLDHLNQWQINEGNENKIRLQKIEQNIPNEVYTFLKWYQTSCIFSVFSQIHKRNEHLRQKMFATLVRKCPGLDAHELKWIAKLTASLVQQNLRIPIYKMKMLAEKNYLDERMLALLTDIFEGEE